MVRKLKKGFTEIVSLEFSFADSVASVQWTEQSEHFRQRRLHEQRKNLGLPGAHVIYRCCREDRGRREEPHGERTLCVTATLRLRPLSFL